MQTPEIYLNTPDTVGLYPKGEYMKSKLSEKELLSALKNIAFVVLGTVFISVGTAIFLVPFDLVAGGMSGIAIIIDNLVASEFVTIDLIVTVLTWGFFAVGFITLGKSFAAKTLVSTIVYPVAFALAHRLAEPGVLGGYFYLQGSNYNQIAFVLAAIIGGALVGTGCALAFLGGGSTGGVDIIALTVSKYFPKFKSYKVLFIVDATVVLLGVFVIQNFVVSMLGIVSALVSALMVDRVFLGGSKALVAHIITENAEELNRLIIEDVHRTSTIIDVTGGYTGDRKKMIIVSFTMRQYPDLLSAINKADKYAFVTFHRAHEINGEGWTR